MAKYLSLQTCREHGSEGQGHLRTWVVHDSLLQARGPESCSLRGVLILCLLAYVFNFEQSHIGLDSIRILIDQLFERACGWAVNVEQTSLFFVR